MVALGVSGPDQLIAAAVATGYAGTGAFLTRRQPRNAVGWVIGLIGLTLAIGGASNGYLWNGPRRYDGVANVFSDLSWNRSLPLLVGVALPLLFPDGRLLSPRWRWVAVAGLIGAAFVQVPAINLLTGAIAYPGAA